MTRAWNIYCDESCHLELDGQSHMVIGALACPKNRVRTIKEKLQAVKRKHGVHPKLELKWTKVSAARLALFSDYLDVFLQERDLRFRAVVIQKSQLDHKKHDSTHDEFYYKMFFQLLVHMPLEIPSEHYIYIDIKDTRSEAKVRKLERILRRDLADSQQVIKRVQHIHSHEIEQAQLADILIGAVSYENRSINDSSAKRALIAKLKAATHLNLTQTTSAWALKMNLLVWKAGLGADV